MRVSIVIVVAFVAQVNALSLTLIGEVTDKPYAVTMEEELTKYMQNIGKLLKDSETPGELIELEQKVAALSEPYEAIALPEQIPGYIVSSEFNEKGLKEQIPGIEEKCEQYGVKISELMENGKLDAVAVLMTWKANKDNPKEVAKNPLFFEAMNYRNACCQMRTFSYCQDLSNKGMSKRARQEVALFEKNIDKLAIPEIFIQMEKLVHDDADRWRKQRLIQLVFGEDRERIMRYVLEDLKKADKATEVKDVCQEFSDQMKAIAEEANVDFDFVLYILSRNRNMDCMDRPAQKSMRYVALREACLKISQLLVDEK